MKFKTAFATAIALLVTSLAGCASSTHHTSSAAPSAQKTDIKMMMLPSVVYRMPVLLAQQQGYFNAAGIDVSIVPQPSGLTTVQALSATKANVGISTLAAVAGAYQVGEKDAFFCGSQSVIETSLLVAPGSTLPLVTSGASPARAFAALAGKKIGIQTPIGSPLAALFKAALDQAGVRDVHFVTTGTNPSIGLAALQRHTIDVLTTSAPVTQELVASGKAKQLMFLPTSSDLYRTMWGSGFWAERSWLKTHAAAAQALCSAVGKAVSYMNDAANAAAVDTLMEQNLNVDSQAADLVRQQSLPTFTTSIDTASFDKTCTILTSGGVLKASPTVNSSTLIANP